MPGDRRAKKVAAAPDLELEDRISALPDGVLQHLLGFLPADEAVRTSVLARHWRHQWRSVRRLRIDCDMPWSAEDLIKFGNRLMLLRAPGMALDEFQVVSRFELDPEVYEEIPIWIRHALMCKVQVLIIDVSVTLDPPLISQYLRRLEISHHYFRSDCLDFASCPALEFLHIEDSGLYCPRILSQSIKHLRIKNSHFVGDIRACISMPSLISLQLNHFEGKTPLFEFMPSLQSAFVKPADPTNHDWVKKDACTKKGDSRDDCCGICTNCCGEDDQKGRCVLLWGLSNATYLELIAYPGTSIFKRDLRWCPAFSKLKTLLLNEWCVHIDFSALVCILEHSPVLEKLILQISKDAKCKSESGGRHHQTERKLQVSKHLKIVEIKCQNVGSRVCEIVTFLSKFIERVTIIRVTKDSNLFSFED